MAESIAGASRVATPTGPHRPPVVVPLPDVRPIRSLPLLPSFPDPEVEAAWRAHRNEEARGPVRAGLVFFGVLIMLAALGDPWQAYEGWRTIVVIRLTVWGPICLVGAWLLTLPEYRGRALDVILCVCVSCTLSLVATMGLVVPRGAAVDYPMYWTVLLLLVHVFAPLGVVRSTLAGTFVVAGFFVTMFRHDATGDRHFAAHAVFLLFAWALLVVASGVLERHARASFLAERRRRELEAQVWHIQKMEAIGRFVGGVAHEFNNLLTPILGGVEMAASALSPDHPLQRSLGNVEHAGQRAAQLVQQLLALGRRSEIRPRALDLTASVAEAVSLVRPTMDRRVTLAFDGQPDAWARVDPGQVQQILLNLCSNARDALLSEPHRGREARVDISVRRVHVGDDAAGDERPGDWVEIRVADTGPGIAHETMARLFEPFFTTKKRGEGSGLGLSVVHGIVSQHGGWVAVEPGPGRGATVRCMFPAVSAPDVPEPDVAGPTLRAGRTGAKRVLVVDDEQAVRDVARAGLEFAGYVVDDEARALVAIERLRAGFRPDAIVLDVRMPELDGWGALARIRVLVPSVPVLMISGFDPIPDGAVPHRPDAVLPKPFRLQELVAEVDALVGSAGRAGG
jgi:signal transduction histidine kinase